MEDEREGRLWEHFSHGHLLVLGNPPPEGNPVCHGCKTTIFPAKLCYMCRKCPFFLHQVCFGMPKNVHHPIDSHPLGLSSLKISATCKACGQSISTFYYGCVKCQSFYHVLCLAMPLSVKVPSHPHALTLEFSPPYDFRCDLCARPCYATHAAWLYHCSLCEFDVHISCAVTNTGAQFLHESGDGCRVQCGSKRQELMELLWRGINRNHQETPVKLEDMATPSYQFSDACFSSDFAKSVLDDEDTTGREGNLPEHGGKTTAGGYVNLPKPLTAAAAPHHHHAQRSSSLDSMSESSKKELNVKISSPISSRVWMEIDPESKKDFQTQKSQNVKERRSCCSSILNCW